MSLDPQTVLQKGSKYTLHFRGQNFASALGAPPQDWLVANLPFYFADLQVGGRAIAGLFVAGTFDVTFTYQNGPGMSARGAAQVIEEVTADSTLYTAQVFDSADSGERSSPFCDFSSMGSAFKCIGIGLIFAFAMYAVLVGFGRGLGDRAASAVAP